MRPGMLRRFTSLKRTAFKRTRAVPRKVVATARARVGKTRANLLNPKLVGDVALDDICREIAFARDEYRCVRCGRESHESHWNGSRFVYAGFHWAHVDSRRFKSVRWNPINSMCLCEGCHWWWHNPRRGDQPSAWFASRYPERDALLNLIAQQVGTRPELDRWLTRLSLLQELARLAPDVHTYYRNLSVDAQT